MELGEKIKMLREQKNMTLEELGNAVGVGKSTVRKWENGMIANMRRDKIAKVAAALDVSPGYLMGWDEGKDTLIVDSNAEMSQMYEPENPALLQAAADKELFDTYHRLDQDRKKQLKEYARYLLFQQEEEAKEKGEGSAG